MKTYAKTKERHNVTRHEHSWTIRTVGYPEIRDLRQLLSILDTNRFCYRIINVTRGRTYYVDPTKSDEVIEAIYHSTKQLLHEGFDTTHKKHIWSKTTGELLNYNFNEVIRVLVYKNTTRFNIVTR